MLEFTFSDEATENSKQIERIDVNTKLLKLKESINSISNANKALDILNYKLKSLLFSLEFFSEEKEKIAENFEKSENLTKKNDFLEESFAKSCIFENTSCFDETRNNEYKGTKAGDVQSEKTTKENLIKLCQLQSFNKSSMAILAIKKVIEFLYENRNGATINEIVKGCGVAKYRVLEVIGCLEKVIENLNMDLLKEDGDKKGEKIYKLEF